MLFFAEVLIANSPLTVYVNSVIIVLTLLLLNHILFQPKQLKFFYSPFNESHSAIELSFKNFFFS